jgi:hypothetical protein
MARMLERGVDQASGLRRSMPATGGPVLPVAGAGEHPECAVRLAIALADAGTTLTVVSDFEAVLQGLSRERSRAGLRAVHSQALGPGLQGLAGLSARSALTLVAVDDLRLARGLGLPATEAVVLSGADTEAIATAYARIKALVGLGAIRDVCTLFDRGTGGAPARHGHLRLARAAARFLGVELAFGGAAPDAPVPGAWRRLAEDLAEWSRECGGRTAWRPH